MKIGKSIMLILCFCMLGLTACGEVIHQGNESNAVTDEVAATLSSLSIEKDGSISSTIIENFIESYYNEDDLKSMIESAIDEYKADNVTAQIELKNFKVKDGVTNITIEYGDYQTYAGFDREDFFAGTIRDANMAGYDLDVTLKSVADNTTVSKPELLGMGDSHIVFFEYTEEPEVLEQLRINCYDEILYVNDEVTVVGKKSADISSSKGCKIIVFK
ncbi:MAG: hypothetical protein K2K74_11380 [Lachnospiraceae bacterium]|nr:hypothetical protein [Lachnospiraceae bacterium]